MKTGGIAHYPDPTDKPYGRIDTETGTVYLHFAGYLSPDNAWVATESSLYLRRLAATADQLADQLDTNRATLPREAVTP